MNKKLIAVRISLYVLSLAINVFIIIQSCLNASQSTDQSGWVVDFLASILNFFNKNAVTKDNYGQFAGVVRKLIGHFGLFFVSGFLTSVSAFLIIGRYRWYKAYWAIIISLGVGLSLALLTEGIQLNVSGRSGELTDSLIDFSGYLLSSIGVFLFFFLKDRKHNACKEDNILE